MELTLKNFRCYKEKTFSFPLGVTLVNGPSGKGKSTILHAIKYALFGKVQGVCSYGEKKTTVSLTMLGLHITRTNIPSRVVVRYEQTQYEDDAAQEMIYKRVGNQFDITSYMIQKGLSQFFNLSGSEKLLVLEELSLQGDASIQSMKQSIQAELKEVRTKFTDEQSQLKVLEKQLKPVVLQKKQGIRTVSDVQALIRFSRSLTHEWNNERDLNESMLRDYSKAMKQQQQVRATYETLDHQLTQLYMEQTRLRTEKEALVWSDEQLSCYKDMVMEHDRYTQYETTQREYHELETMYHTLLQQERDAYDKDIQTLLSKKVVEQGNLVDLQTLLDQTLRAVEQKKRYEEITLELGLDKYKELDTKWETTKKQIERVKSFLTDLDQRKCVQSCPHCKKGVVIRSNQVHVSDNHALSESDKTKETDYRQKLPLLVKQEETQHRLIGVRDALRHEQQGLSVTDTSDANVVLYRTQIEREQKNRTINESIQQQLNEKQRVLPETKYKDMKKKLDSYTVRLAQPNGTRCDDVGRIQDAILVMEASKREEKRLVGLLHTVETTIAKREQEKSTVTIDTTDYHTLLDQTMSRQQWITNRQSYANAMLASYVQYEGAMKDYVAYKKTLEDIHEKQKLCLLYQVQLENLEKLLTQIIKTEGVCLEKFLQVLNNKIGWYMDEFFKDSSLKMTLDSEKECKSGKIRHEISVRILQNTTPCELKSLSGGEYDRCALAFMLAINELSHSPCLFLDESISSLDMNLSEDVLEVIKEKFLKTKWVLLVSHQANTGFFDHVVNL